MTVVACPTGDRTGADERWDRFVKDHPAGEHVQSSAWTRLKATEGWRAIRIEAADGDDLIGGAQVLIRDIPVLGSFAYVPKGPLSADLDTARSIIAEIEGLTNDHRIRHLTIQPPRGGEEVEAVLQRRAFSKAPIEVAPASTLILDLGASEDELMAAMSRTTRYNVRLGMRRGLTTRLGTRADIPEFREMLVATAQRQRFTPHSTGYLEAMWDVFEAEADIALLLIEYEGRVVSGRMGIGFGDTFTDKLGAWSGEAGKLRPNHAVVWSAIRWAREAGYRHFDFEGIDLAGALALRAGEELPTDVRDSVTSFKVGFGGAPVIMPSAWHRIDNRFIVWLYDRYTGLRHGARLAEYLSNQLRRGRTPRAHPIARSTSTHGE